MRTTTAEFALRDGWCQDVGLSVGRAASPVSLKLAGGHPVPSRVRPYGPGPGPGPRPPGAEDAGSGRGLELVTDFSLDDDFAVVEWRPWLVNQGTAASPVVAEWLSAAVAICGPGVAQRWLRYANGSSATVHDFAPHRAALRPGTKRVLRPSGGRSSSGVLPFFNLATGDGGVVVAIGWSGQWQAEFECRRHGEVVLRAGLEPGRFYLEPGETLRGPRIVLLFWAGGDEDRGQNLWRRWMSKTSKAGADETAPAVALSAATWGETPAGVHARCIDQIVADDLPFERYWVDAGWFGHGSWRQSVGSWAPNPQLWPDGIGPVAERAHAAGMKMALWFEPERVARGSDWAEEHPEWLLRVGEETAVLAPPETDEADRDLDWVEAESCRTELGPGDALVNLGEPGARAGVTEHISELVARWGIDVYRHDFNFAPLQFWRQHDGPDRAGVTEMKYIAGLYDFLDALLARHPGLQIDNCASGGRRLDVEMMRRSLPLARSDYFFDPVGHQCQTYGLSMWTPGHAAIAHTGFSRYALLSALTSGLSLSWCRDFNQPEAAPVEVDADQVRAVLGECMSLRPYFSGDFYPLTPYSASHRAWLAYQFHRPETADGVALAFRRPQCPSSTTDLGLKALVPGWHYDLDIDGCRQSLSGAQLAHGLPVRCPEQPGVCVVRYASAGPGDGQGDERAGSRAGS